MNYTLNNVLSTKYRAREQALQETTLNCFQANNKNGAEYETYIAIYKDIYSILKQYDQLVNIDNDKIRNKQKITIYKNVNNDYLKSLIGYSNDSFFISTYTKAKIITARLKRVLSILQKKIEPELYKNTKQSNIKVYNYHECEGSKFGHSHVSMQKNDQDQQNNVNKQYLSHLMTNNMLEKNMDKRYFLDANKHETFVKEFLLSQGYTQDQIDKLCSPTGINKTEFNTLNITIFIPQNKFDTLNETIFLKDIISCLSFDIIFDNIKSNKLKNLSNKLYATTTVPIAGKTLDNTKYSWFGLNNKLTQMHIDNSANSTIILRANNEKGIIELKLKNDIIYNKSNQSIYVYKDGQHTIYKCKADQTSQLEFINHRIKTQQLVTYKDLKKIFGYNHYKFSILSKYQSCVGYVRENLKLGGANAFYNMQKLNAARIIPVTSSKNMDDYLASLNDRIDRLNDKCTYIAKMINYQHNDPVDNKKLESISDINEKDLSNDDKLIYKLIEQYNALEINTLKPHEAHERKITQLIKIINLSFTSCINKPLNQNNTQLYNDMMFMVFNEIKYLNEAKSNDIIIAN